MYKPELENVVSDIDSDSSVWYVSDATYGWLWEQINNPPPPTQALIQAMQSKRVWETDEEHDERMIRHLSQLDDTAC